MALMQRTQIGVRDIGTSVTVPDDPKAKLMFYLSCVATVLDIEDVVPRRLMSFATNYNRLSREDITDLLAHCILFSPDELKDKCFFEDSSGVGVRNNFLELSAVQSAMLMAGNAVIGGQNRRVAKIMTYTPGWLRANYEEPMIMVLALQLHDRSRREIQQAERRRRRCLVM